MRILTVLNSLGMGGAEKQALAVAARMVSRGHAVAILSLMPRLPQEWPTELSIVSLEIGKNPASLFPGVLRAWNFLREFRPDLLHSHSFHANLFTRLLAAAAPRAAVVSTVHNVYEGGWPRMMAYRLTDRWADCTVAVSEAAAERFVRLKAIPSGKCKVRTNGIDTTEFAPDPQRRAQMRKKMLGDEDEVFVWLAAGRIAPAKDYPNLLRAFAALHRQQSQARLWIAGEGAMAAVAEVQAAAVRLGIQAAVRWLGLCREMPALLDAADGFVLGSAWEGLPLVIGEAMAMEKPVVATDVGGVRELVDAAGTLVPAKDAEALAAAMRMTMQTSGEERARLGRTARERIEQRFSIDAAADWWEAIYRQCSLRDFSQTRRSVYT